MFPFSGPCQFKALESGPLSRLLPQDLSPELPPTMGPSEGVGAGGVSPHGESAAALSSSAALPSSRHLLERIVG